MSSAETRVVTTRRQRIVEGSCWPCKRRRVKCDLRKPSCKRCIVLGTTCDYSVLNIRWNTSRTKVIHLSMPETENTPSLRITLQADDRQLAHNERKALDYFAARLWPLLSTLDQPCPAPISLALRFRPVLQTMCVFADTHLALQQGRTSMQTLTHQRLSCLSSIREHLNAQIIDQNNLSLLLTAVLFLYLLDGFVDCAQQHASTQSHYSGALALIQELGGFQNVRMASSRVTSMLLSEFASTDLTGALLQGRTPYLPPSIWHEVELRPVWWEAFHVAPASLASIFGIMAEMSFYLHSTEHNGQQSLAKIADFERALQPTYLILDHTMNLDADTELLTDHQMAISMAMNSLCRAFQHAALVYLYRAISCLPTRHSLVQQHVQACLESIRSIDSHPKVQNCSLFPLYVAGAHAMTEELRAGILEKLDSIYNNLRFESVICVRSDLELLWQSDRQMGSWTRVFENFTETTLIL